MGSPSANYSVNKCPSDVTDTVGVCGIAGDLAPSTSRCTLVPLKVAYKKLRLLVDWGCVFIGHGLQKDFRIISASLATVLVSFSKAH